MPSEEFLRRVAADFAKIEVRERERIRALQQEQERIVQLQQREEGFKAHEEKMRKLKETQEAEDRSRRSIP